MLYKINPNYIFERRKKKPIFFTVKNPNEELNHRLMKTDFLVRVQSEN